MNSINKVILIGHLGKDPDVRYTPQNNAVASFSLATSEKWTGKDGQKQEKTDWHNIVAWNKTGEICGQYLRKGSPVYVEGKITNRSWEDRDGNKKYITEIVAHQVIFLAQNQGQQQHNQQPHGFEDQGYRAPQQEYQNPNPTYGEPQDNYGIQMPPQEDMPF